MKDRKQNKISEKNEDNLLPLAFDVNEKLEIPDGYVLNETEEKLSLAFFEESKKDENKNLNYKKIKEINKIEFSLNVNSQLFIQDIYKNFDIKCNWIYIIKEEFKRIKLHFSQYKNFKHDLSLKDNNEQNLSNQVLLPPRSFQEILEIFNLKTLNLILIPSNNDCAYLVSIINNKLCLKLLKHIFSFFDYNSSNKDNILKWIYFLLMILEQPLVDIDLAILYAFNKKLYKFIDINNKNNDSLNLQLENDIKASKMVFVILSEVFNQKLVKI